MNRSHNNSSKCHLDVFTSEEEVERIDIAKWAFIGNISH